MGLRAGTHGARPGLSSLDRARQRLPAGDTQAPLADVFILGGAVSERFAEFAPLLHSPAELRAAHFAGQAGVVGAALAAAEA